MSDDIPRNRKERRAASKASSQPIAPPNVVPKIKLQQADRSQPATKTLLDLYEEKKSLLEHGQPFDSQDDRDAAEDDRPALQEIGDLEDPIGRVGNAVFWSISLGMIHFTLDVLVYSQYMQEIKWRSVVQRALMAVPVLFFFLMIMTSDLASRFPFAKQLLFCGIAIGAGCYVIHAANVFGYYAVMKRAPPLGTLWVWSVVEMRLPYAVVSLLVDLGFLWYMGYSVV